MKWHGRPARESRAGCACHARTEREARTYFHLGDFPASKNDPRNHTKWNWSVREFRVISWIALFSNRKKARNGRWETVPFPRCLRSLQSSSKSSSRRTTSALEDAEIATCRNANIDFQIAIFRPAGLNRSFSFFFPGQAQRPSATARRNPAASRRQ